MEARHPPSSTMTTTVMNRALHGDSDYLNSYGPNSDGTRLCMRRMCQGCASRECTCMCDMQIVALEPK
jgi:hypothetical protein